MIIMSSSEYINRLFSMASRNTYYSNKYPYNLCYNHPDGRTSADCWNLIKALLNGYDVNNHNVGYYQKNLSNTGDVDGAGLLAKCTDVSGNFSLLKKGEPRLLYMPGHAGSYVGEFYYNDKNYNVIECTGAWERKILFSWVDSDGTRRHYRNGPKNGKWTKHGKMTAWLDYGTQPSPKEVIVTASVPILQKGSKGDAVRALQALLKIGVDGDFGNITDKAVRTYQTAQGLTSDGIVGEKTWSKLLNNM